jgi:hypothetical protein
METAHNTLLTRLPLGKGWGEGSPAVRGLDGMFSLGGRVHGFTLLDLPSLQPFHQR